MASTIDDPKTANPLHIGADGVNLLNLLTSQPEAWSEEDEARDAQLEASGTELPEIDDDARKLIDNAPLSFEALEQQLREFEDAERARLGLEKKKLDQWTDANPQHFTAAQRPHTTMLLGGLTIAQDMFAAAAFKSLGYKVQPLEVPDTDALQVGKEFGNRGQCNPTYFTVGNLIKTLIHMRDVEGIPTEEIVDKYLFMTAGACGPCRFGTYVTEYRKALRDAGFEGFRVMLFQQQGGLKQATGDKPGLDLNPAFFIGLLKAIVAGDCLNALGYRIRPYEVVPGSTDEAIDECRQIIVRALENKKSVLVAMARCRKILDKVAVNRLQPKPKVMIIGEFWAMTTEGDGNHELQRFLEEEGAECDIQLVTAWVLYNIWEHQYDTRRRMRLRGADEDSMGLGETQPYRKLAGLWFAEKALRLVFQTFANILGLHNYHLPDMEDLANVSHDFYRNELRGGEGHMEVGKLIQSVEKQKAHMVVSVKPFGCMPSSGVSDGVQSLVTKHYPEAIFCPIETNGDGAVNFYSRVQMFLFKARQRAKAEFQEQLAEKGLTPETAERKQKRKMQRGLWYPKHEVVGTGANSVLAL